MDNGVYYEYWIDDVIVRVPEPSALMCLAIGTAWLLSQRRRFRQHAP